MFDSNKKLLINLSNLHSGGAIQVAVSFIEELSRIDELPLGLAIIASSEVHDNLQEIKCDLSCFNNYEVFNTYGVSGLWSSLRRKIQNFDVVFTLFGPLYSLHITTVSVVGFAQSWIIYPENEVSRTLSFFQRMIVRFKFLIQWQFFKNADKLVVELEHVKNRLIQKFSLDCKNVYVVHNCLNSIYLRPEHWAPLDLTVCDTTFSLGFVCRDYPHKNTDILPRVRQVLIDLYGIKVDFYVTLNTQEWESKSDFFRENIKNVGVLSVAQCPTFYKKMNAVIFPSFLESFSATPLEAMFMKKSLFASDRSFVRDVCGDFAYYFDPENPIAAAELIADYINNKHGFDDGKLLSARVHVVESFNATRRAENYLKIIQVAASHSS